MAIGLLGLVVLSMSGLFLGSQASAVHSLEGSRGSQVAEAEMAYLKGLPWTTLTAYVSTPPAPKTVKSDDVDLVVDPPPGYILRASWCRPWRERESSWHR